MEADTEADSEGDTEGDSEAESDGETDAETDAVTDTVKEREIVIERLRETEADATSEAPGLLPSRSS